MRGCNRQLAGVLGIALLAITAFTEGFAMATGTQSGTKTADGTTAPRTRRGFAVFKPRRTCKSVPFGVDKFLKAQTGFPSNLRRFFPPAPDVPAQATAPVQPGNTPPSVFALADIHGALDAWVKEQIECQCGGEKGSSDCLYKDWKPWKVVKGTVETCKGRGSLFKGREEIRVKIKATNVLVFGQTIDAIDANAGDFLATDTIFGEKLTSSSVVDPAKWVFGDSEFEWTFNKGTDVDMGLINYFLRQGDPPPNEGQNTFTPLNLTPYQASLKVRAKSGKKCLIVEVTQSDKQYLKDPEVEDSGDTPKIVDC